MSWSSRVLFLPLVVCLGAAPAMPRCTGAKEQGRNRVAVRLRVI